MALIQAEVDIANQSLGKIGASQMTLALQTTPQGVQANLHYSQTRNSLLRSFVWPFAKTRIRLVSAWLTDTDYTTDMYVWESSLLYKCIVAHTSGTFATDLTAADWTLVSDIDAWVTLTAYTVGQFVTINALLYKCLVAHTAGVFATDLAAGDWVVVTVKPTNVFGYNYDLPAGSVRLHEYVDGDEATWRLETNTILTDDIAVDIVYIDKVTTTTEWDYMFTEMMIWRLADNLLAPLAGAGSGTSVLQDRIDRKLKKLEKQARAIGRNEGGNNQQVTWSQARRIAFSPGILKNRNVNT